MKCVAGLKVTTKAVKRSAEAISADIAARQPEGNKARPAVGSAHPDRHSPIPAIYVELNGTGICAPRPKVRPLIPGKSNWDASLPKPAGTSKALQFATRTRHLHRCHRGRRGVRTTP